MCDVKRINVFARSKICKIFVNKQKKQRRQYQNLFRLVFSPELAGRDTEFMFEGSGETVVIAETEHFCNIPDREDGFFQ